MNSLEVERQLHPSGRVAVEVRGIYAASFPATLQMDFAELLATVAEGKRWLFTAQRAGRVAGFAVIMPLPGLDVYLLEYLATDERCRSQGVGSALLGEIAACLRKLGGAAGMVLEVESDEEKRPDQIRRIEFYRRNGAEIVQGALQYRAPNLAGPGTLAMKLMWRPLDSLGQTLCGERLRACITGIYTASYDLAPGDPLIAATLGTLTC